MPVPLISMLLPTRGRPDLVLRLFESIRRHTRHLDRVEVVLYADEDDVGSHGLNDTALRVKATVGPQLTMGGYNTACLANAEGQIVILVNDDMVVQTDGWDVMVRELDDRFPDRIYLGYGNDLFKGRKLCSFPILSRTACEILGEPFPRAYQGAFIDYHLLDIFKRLERGGHSRICYLERLIFEHRHYRTGKAEFDATYQRRDRFADDPVFLALRDSRSAAAARLRAHVEGKPMNGTHARFVAPSGARSPTIALAGHCSAILRDDELPFRWRGFLFAWFCARSLASRWYRARGGRGSPARPGNA